MEPDTPPAEITKRIGDSTAGNLFGSVPAGPDNDADSTEKPGDRIGHYKLLELLGEGGFGMVWRAEQTDLIHREVGLKVIKPGMDSREIIARFEAEQQALAMMDHPNIARMFEGGSTPAGRPYFAMEYVKGAHITMFCDEHKLSLEMRIRVFMEVCAAVQHAHQKAILHRDLKPSNILVSEVEGRIVPKVIDFGVAKALGAQLTDKTMFTKIGMAIGTPQYMSPEQVGVLAHDVDTRSDVYSLGAILYELLTGSTPLRREEAGSLGFSQLQEWMRDKEPERPSTRIVRLEKTSQQKVARDRHADLSRLPRTLRGDLDWIVMRALEKDRNRRYQTANALALDLGRYLKGDPVEAGPPSASYRFGKLLRKNKVLVTTSAVVALALVVGAGVAWRGQIQALRSAQQAQHARDGAEKLLNSMLFDLRKALVGLGRTDVLAKLAETAKSYYAGLDDNQRNAETEHRLSGALLIQGDALYDSGHTAEALPIFREVLARGEDYGRKHPSNSAATDVALAHMRLGHLFLHMKQLEESRTHYAAAIPILEGLLAKSPQDQVSKLRLAIVLTHLGRALVQMRRAQEALPLQLRAITLLTTADGSADTSPTLGGLSLIFDEEVSSCDSSYPFYYVAGTYSALKMPDKSREMQVRALQIREALSRQDPSNAVLRRGLAWSLMNVSGILERKGDVTGRREHLGRAHAILEGLRNLDPSNLVWQKDFAWCLRSEAEEAWVRKDQETALSLARQAVELWKMAAEHDVQNMTLLHEYRDMVIKYLRYMSLSGHREQAIAFADSLLKSTKESDSSPISVTLKTAITAWLEEKGSR